MKICDRARKQALINENLIPVSLNNEDITYRELETESNILAGLLKKRNLKPGNLVALFMEKTPKTVIAMLGILKAGGNYVPLDTQSPAEKLIESFRSFKPDLLFLDHETTHLFQHVIHRDSESGLIPWVWWSDFPMIHGDDFPPQFIYQDLKTREHQQFD